MGAPDPVQETVQVPKIETRSRDIVARLKRDGWVEIGGTRHAQFTHAARPGVLIVVPRHREVSPGVARSIAKLAEWI
jgi:predicted RNA binding protein YcfA (HicA-like mRNA interferase family)